MNSFVPLENIEDVVSILSQISLFGGISEAQQDEIFSRLEVGRFKKGQFIFQKGDEPSHVYIVKSGLIELFIPDKEGMLEKKRLGVGECFGQLTSTHTRLPPWRWKTPPHRFISAFSVPGGHRPVCPADDEYRQGTGTKAPVHG